MFRKKTNSKRYADRREENNNIIKNTSLQSIYWIGGTFVAYHFV